MRKILLPSVVILVLLTGKAVASEFSNKDPYRLVEAVASRTFERIKSEQSIIQQNPNQLRGILEEELMPYVDHRFAAFKVLGKHARKAPKDQLLKYVEVFRNYLVESYVVGLSHYDDQSIEFEPVSDFSDKKMLNVRTTIKDDERPDIVLIFKMRRGRDGNWKAYDMVAEGISMISSKQSQYEAVLRQKGLPYVISSMQEEINKTSIAKDSD
jgi:phospholipid transport system substrate-binding protein